MSRILFSTYGTLGDLHPYLAIGLALVDRGHRAVIATSPYYRNRVESLGLEFAPVRPERPPFERDPELGPYYMDQRRGSERIVREVLMPSLSESYGDLFHASGEVDLIVSHSLSFAASLVAEKKQIPWVSSVVAPLSFFSWQDPPVLAPAPWLAQFRSLGEPFHRFLFRQVRKVAKGWGEPWHRMRAELGLPPGEDPIFEGQHSPFAVLAMFSKSLAEPQEDWPSNTFITGFPFFEEASTTLHPDLMKFVDDSSPYIVFTLGSSAVWARRQFYRESAEAARKLRIRALLIGAIPGGDVLPELLSSQTLAIPYAPYKDIFQRAAVVVHQGGVGTLGRAMEAGRPMLVLPHAHDQFDNAYRTTRMGIARNLRIGDYHGGRVVVELKKLLEEKSYAENAARIAKSINKERGSVYCCEVIERVLSQDQTFTARTSSQPKTSSR